MDKMQQHKKKELVELMDTYTHFGSGAPQSAQDLFAGWFRRWSNLSAALKGPVSNHGST